MKKPLVVFGVLISLLSGRVTYAMTAKDLSNLSNVALYGYLMGVGDSIIAEDDITGKSKDCVKARVLENLHIYIKAFKTAKSEGNSLNNTSNVAALISVTTSHGGDCKLKSGFDISKYHLTATELLEKNSDVKAGYALGVIDQIYGNAKYSTKRSDCILNWGPKQALQYFSTSIKTRKDDTIMHMMPAGIFHKGAKAACGNEKRDLSNLRGNQKVD